MRVWPRSMRCLATSCAAPKLSTSTVSMPQSATRSPTATMGTRRLSSRTLAVCVGVMAKMMPATRE